MLSKIIYFILIGLTTQTLVAGEFCENQDYDKLVLCVDFDDYIENGTYEEGLLKYDWGEPLKLGKVYKKNEEGKKIYYEKFHHGIENDNFYHGDNYFESANRAKIRNKQLVIEYPEKKFGPAESGASWIIDLTKENKKGYEELTLEYKIKFNKGFQFASTKKPPIGDRHSGGKLPGLCGGNCNTGGKIPTGDKGWSARYMWDGKKFGLTYLYYNDMDKPKKFRDIHFPKGCPKNRDGVCRGQVVNKYFYKLSNPTNRDRYRCSNQEDTNKGIKFEANIWYTLKQEIKMNRPQQRFKQTGQLKVYLNGDTIINCSNLYFRDTKKLAIDKFYFSTFFGGNKETDSPDKGVKITFDDFLITE